MKRPQTASGLSRDPPAGTSLRFCVEAPQARLDRYLAQAIEGLSRSQVQRLIERGCVLVDGATGKSGAPLSVGTVVEVHLPAEEDENPLPPPPLVVLYEDDELLAIDKPARVVVHPAPGHQGGTIVDSLGQHYPSLVRNVEGRPGVVHRLDKETSGVLLVAKTESALIELTRQFKERLVGKRYQAIVIGKPPTPTGVIDAPIERDPINRKKMRVGAKGRPARTRYRVERSYRNHALLRLHPETGRTHQIRVHLAWLGCPVLGDRTYGGARAAAGAPRHMLHAVELTFTHPVTRERLVVTAPLPLDFRQIEAALTAEGGAGT